MIEIYWGCLVSLLFGDLLGDAFHGLFDGISIDGFDFLHPMTLVSAVTLFGGIGLMLTKYTSNSEIAVGIISGTGAALFAVLIFFIYVKPMKNTESSIGYSMAELVGRPGEVTIPIPAGGYGEVEVRFGSQKTYQIAAAYDDVDIPSGTHVIVVEVREGTAYVTADL